MRKMPIHVKIPGESDIISTFQGRVETFSCNFVTMTPMFGGGAKTKTVDEYQPVRAPSVRGALREWWRLLNRYDRNGSMVSDEELYRRECLIWGGMSYKKDPHDTKVQALPSAVRVEVSGWSVPKPLIQIAENDTFKPKFIPELGNKKYPQYAVWPFQGQKGRNGKASTPPDWGVNCGLSFTVTITYDTELIERRGQDVNDMKKQVKLALTAWANFGGVGARPRRGLGALYCDDLAFKNEEELARFVAQVPVIDACLLGEEEKNLQGRTEAEQKTCTALLAWISAVVALGEFRQGEGIGRKDRGDSQTPGRSYGPEPSEIRKYVPCKNLPNPDHKEPVPQAKGVEGFPRANFGMPIGFKFGGRDNEPEESQLYPIVKQGDKHKDRMVSPLILRPIRFRNGEVRPMALFFPVPSYESLVLVEDNKSKKEYPVEKAGAFQAPVSNNGSPLKDFRPDQALEAFAFYISNKREEGSSKKRFHYVKDFREMKGGKAQ